MDLAATVPSSLLLQWHITERCNLRCAHCYQESHGGEELDLAGVLGLLNQFEDWHERLCGRAGRRLPAQITVTGGEPFARRDFFDLLEQFAARRQRFGFAILSNGSLIDPSVARRLKTLGPRFVQISLEGEAATHDQIRGAGHQARALAAIRCLADAGLRTLVSFTAHRRNFREFPAMAEAARRAGAHRVWADRLVPWGEGQALRDQVLSPDETREFVGLMASAQSGWWRRAPVSLQRALQFLGAGDPPYRCTAGDSLLALQPQGDLYPCRRLPIRVGNLLETPLADLYDHSPLLQSLRDRARIPAGCGGCFYAESCAGGLRCLSHALSGDPFRADPGCWRQPGQDSPSTWFCG